MYAHPDDYALPGDTVTSRINRMLELAPLGTYCEIPGDGYGVLERTVDPVLGPQNYSLRSKRSVSIVSATNVRNPTRYDSSGAGVAHVLLIEPGAPEHTHLQTEIAGLKFGPVGATAAQTLTWSAAEPMCSWAGDVIRIDCPVGTGMGKFRMHDCYLPYGAGWALNITGLSGQASMYGSVFERLWLNGGMRLDHIGDSNSFRDIRLEGKTGLEYRIMNGAGENLFEQFQITPLAGPAVYGRGGNKVTMRQFNIEQKGWDRPGLPKAVMDLRHDDPSFAGMMNALTLDGITVLNQCGVPLDHLIRVGKSYSPILRRINCYAPTQTTTAIEVESNCLYPRIDGPITYDGAITNKLVCPSAARGYGVKVGPQYWNPPFNIPQPAMSIEKSLSGIVTVSGVVTASSVPANGTVVMGLPNGFRAYKEVAIPILSDTGPCFMVAAPQTNDTDGHPVSIESVPAGATRFRLSGSFPEYHHAKGLETNN